MDKVSYALGIGIGRQLASMGAETLNIDDFAQAVKDAIAGKLQISEQEAQELVQNFFAAQEAKTQAAAAEKGKVAKEAGEKFLAENGKKEGIITTKSGLQYQVLREGNGKAPKATDQVECHYEGTLIDGTKFDSSYDRGQTATFPLNQVIAGWTEGLQLMTEGAKYRFFIPYQLGYGERGAGAAIPPFGAVVACAAATFVACGNSTPKADLKNDVDTMSYAMGMSQTQGLKEFLVERMGVDTAYMDDFIKGLNDGANAGDDKKKAAYYAGIQIGQQISNQMVKGINHEVFGNDSTQTISLKNFMAGFITGTTGKKGLMTVEQAQQVAQAKMMAIKAKAMEKQYGPNKQAGEKFLAANKKKPGVVTLPSGLQYKVIKEGNGPMPKDTSLVKVNYEGKTIDGKVFDSSYKRGDAVTLRANQVIKGWTEALVRMPVGSVWEVYIPQELAYGEREQAQIKPFSALIFKIELVSLGAK